MKNTLALWGKTLIATFLLSAYTSTQANALAQSEDDTNLSQPDQQTLVILEDWQPNNTSVEAYETIWQRIIAAYQLDTSLENPRITAQLNWYKARQDYLNRVAERGERYLYFIAEQIEAREIPGEIALLPIVESAFEPFAYSHGRASGVWQFIPSTGVLFGLKSDHWHDGRRDIRASTIAALTFLDGLQKEFNGDWLLALAAYNSGAGTVRKAIRLNKARGKPTDFWSLDLPRETRDYVPKLLALAKLVRTPEQYHVSLLPIPDEPYFAVAKTGGQIDLSQVAKLSDTPIEEIYNLNPSFNNWATHPNGPHEILIPYQQLDAFNEQLSQLPASDRVKWQMYQVQKGDSLITISKKFNTTTDVLQSVNGIRGNIIQVGQLLNIPSAMHPQSRYAFSENARHSRLVSARQPANSKTIHYTVKNGDSFWSIARHHGVQTAELARWNGMAPRDPLSVGRKLVIHQKVKTSTTGFTPPAQREVIRKITYTVRKGDSLARISQKHNVRISDIKRWNSSQVSNKYLQPGQKLTLHVDVTR
ncbi:MAG: LysM peptidoglycan-binding domain-containing protein [Venatoribacter sp.]